MLYYIQSGDSLSAIAERFGSTVQDILAANVVCNLNLIYIGQALIIPVGLPQGVTLPKSGGSPYYIIQPSDTLYCLAVQFNTTVRALVENNRIQNPNVIYPGTELLVLPVIPDPETLRKQWEETARLFCNNMSTIMEHGIYLIGTYQWEALGSRAIPYLLELLRNRCRTVRYHAVMALGRIAQNGSVKQALQSMNGDTSIANLARLAIKRIELGEQGRKRIHLTFGEHSIHNAPNLDSPSVPLSEGTEVIILTWHVPSPTAEEGPRGDIQVYDWVQVVRTGQVGFLPRVGFNDAPLI